MEDLNLQDVYDFAVDLAKQAGQMLLDAANQRVTNASSGSIDFTEKDNAVDIVTQTDNDVEAFIHASIQAKYPTHAFIGEESYAATSSKQRPYLIPKEGPSWCVDPLDGTVNFFHLCPFYCVSIAFLIDGEPVIGAINAPFLRQTFSACKGKGAWLNETVRLPLNPSPLPLDAPKGCILSCEWGKDRRDIPGGNLHRKINSFLNLASEIGSREGKGGMVHGVRSLGSATLDLAYIAMGSFDIWWEGGCWEWDVAAGICIVREAGGLVTTANAPDQPSSDAPLPEVHLGSRLYLAIRPATDSATESARKAQERTVRQVWARVDRLDYQRPGI